MLALCILALTSLVGVIFHDLGVALMIVAFVGVGPLVLVEPVAEILARRAEQRREEPGTWYVVDIEREQKRYGVLRAHRFFGHPIGRGKKST